MLLGDIKADIKQVAVVTRSEKFNKLLSSILADWKFFTVSDLAAAKVIFVERGLELPEHDGRVVWLTPMPLAEGSFLTVPISLARLYHLLEVHFFPTPRHHLRVAMDLSVDLKIGKDWQKGRLLSLSDRGGRIACTSEVQRGKSLNVKMELAGRLFKISSEVLYRIPAGDFPGRLQSQVGVLFKPSSDQELTLLRRFIEKICIERACYREDIRFNDLCVSWLDVQTDPWHATD